MPSQHPNTDPVSEIQFSILHYLTDHPQATDSLEGIRNWWLLQSMARLSLPRIQRALDELEQAALIQRVVLGDGRVLYRKASPARRRSLA